MPSTKQGGGYTLTFAKKNMDVKKVLDSKKENKVKITDYLCDAVRFYEEYRDKIDNKNIIGTEEIERLIDEKLKKLKIKTEELELENNHNNDIDLESNLEFINIEDD